MAEPIEFDEFFDSGLEESISPFLTPSSAKWGKNLTLKASLLSGLLLVAAFVCHFFSPLAAVSSLLLVLVYFLAGVPKLIEAIEDLLSFEVNIDVLMTLAAFLSVLIGSPMEGGLLLVLFAISGAIEETVTSRAKGSLFSLHKLSPTKACMIDPDGRTYDRHIRDVVAGATILVRAGEVVPLDGEVIDGISSVNLAHLTGESLPVHKKVGDEVPAGATNMEGALTMRVSHISSDSTLARMIKLITQAQEARPKFQRWIDKVGQVYSIAIICLSFIFATSLPWFTALPYLGHEGSVYRALAFLIAASPCALIIALPIAYLSAISSCARRGILLKGSVTLDALATCHAIAFDKTGTLTTGQLQCLGVEPKSDAIIAAARALETNAVHPISKAIIDFAQELSIAPAKLDSFKLLPGLGLEGTIDGVYTYIGHPAHLQDRLTPAQADAITKKTDKLRKQGELVSVMILGDEIAYFRFQDTPRPDIAGTLAQLKEAGLRILMLTGDHQANADAIAAQVGIDEYYADLRPEDKLNHVSRLSENQGLAMIGDGVNDAPALARATVGISMGEVGSRTAVDASDVVFLQDKIEWLSWLWEKARDTQTIVRQNVGLATIVIIGASVSALLGWIPLWLAVVLHEGGTVIVGINSLRLLK